jgi:phage tail sheath protein FI
MSVTYSYPGIYIQELPLSTQTISPAPTSITAFVGYTHPWKTVAFKTAVQLFSFTDYETYFGGLYSTGYFDNDVAQAVYQFFQNGGNNAYVVGLQPQAYGLGGAGEAQFGSASGDLSFTAQIVPDPTQPTVGIALQALEATDIVPMTAAVTNLRSSNPGAPPPLVYDTFDLVITYGTRIEVYRSVPLTVPFGGSATQKSLDQLVNGISTLVTVAPITGASYGTAFPYTSPATQPAPLAPVIFPIVPTGLSASFATTFNPGDFIPMFQANSSLDNVEIFNLLLVPGVTDNTVLSAALEFAERKRAFAVIDCPEQAQASAISGATLAQVDAMVAGMPVSQNGAVYFPYLMTTDLITGYPMAVPPSGYVAGIYASTDASRGVWKAPAGLAASLLGTSGPVASGVMNDMQQGVLNLNAVNCLRTFTGAGTVVYGARTLVGGQNSGYPQSKYVPVRRMTLFIEQTLVSNLKWVVFEPNDEPLWLAIRSTIEAFLLSLFNQQALQGSTPSEAFHVKCDSTTTSAADQQNGVVNIVIAVALLKPAEFVIITISQIAGQTA